MSEIGDMLGKPKVFDIAGKKFSVSPSTMEDIDLILDLSGEDIQARKKAMKELITKVIKSNFPTSTDEEIKTLPLEVIGKIVEAIKEVNGMKNG
jgi:hypothetical protein